jgi:hypothetical protein
VEPESKKIYTQCNDPSYIILWGVVILNGIFILLLKFFVGLVISAAPMVNFKTTAITKELTYFLDVGQVIIIGMGFTLDEDSSLGQIDTFMYASVIVSCLSFLMTVIWRPWYDSSVLKLKTARYAIDAGIYIHVLVNRNYDNVYTEKEFNGLVMLSLILMFLLRLSLRLFDVRETQDLLA